MRQTSLPTEPSAISQTFLGSRIRSDRPLSHEVRQYIVDQLESLDLEPRFQEFDAPDYYGISDGAVTGVNVMARLPGVESTGRWY